MLRGYGANDGISVYELGRILERVSRAGKRSWSKLAQFVIDDGQGCPAEVGHSAEATAGHVYGRLRAILGPYSTFDARREEELRNSLVNVQAG